MPAIGARLHGVRTVARRRLDRVLQVRGADLVALWWAWRALRAVRRDLPADGVRTAVAAPKAGLRPDALAEIEALLRWRKATCLQRTLVVQRWLAAHGRPVDIAVGVGTQDNAFAAHAWLPGFDRPSNGAGFREITRIAP